MIYSWRIRYSVPDPTTGGGDWAHLIVRAPTAADALEMFKQNCSAYRTSPRPRYFRGPEHVECFEPEGPFGIWDKQRGDWVRGPSGDIVSGDYVATKVMVEKMVESERDSHVTPPPDAQALRDRWCPCEFRKEM